MKVALLCASGGHLTEMLCLRSSWEEHDHFFITLKCPRTEEIPDRKYLITNPEQGVLTMLRSTLSLARALLTEKPDVIISTGLGWFDMVAFFLSKIIKSYSIYIESWCMTEHCTGTGKAVMFLADEFLVQWPELAEKMGGRAKFMGGVI